MPVLYQQYYNNFSPDMNNQFLSKQYAVNKIQSNSRVFNDNLYLKGLQTNAYNQPIDSKILSDTVDNVKKLYKNNIELMIKLKNKFTSSIGGVPPAPPAAILPPAPSVPPLIMPIAPIAPVIPSPTSSHGMTPLPSPVSTVPAPSMMSSLGSLFGLMSGSGAIKKSRGRKKGGAVRLVETYGIGTEITTLIDTIQNNNNLLKIELLKLLSYQQYLTPTNIKDITDLHYKFFSYFNENIIPYRVSHLIPPMTSLAGIDFLNIIDKLNELYVNYANEFSLFIIPKLNNKL